MDCLENLGKPPGEGSINRLTDLFNRFSLNTYIWQEKCKTLIYKELGTQRGFPGGSEVKASACNAGDLGLIPGSGRSPGEGNGNPLQYSCLENPMDGGAW